MLVFVHNDYILTKAASDVLVAPLAALTVLQDVEVCLDDDCPESDSVEPQTSMPSQPNAAADVHDLTGTHPSIC